MSKAHKSHHY